MPLISLHTDTSDVAVGSMLQQQVKGCWTPLAFLSWQLRKPEMKYSIFHRELLALYLSVRHLRFYFQGRPFTAFTDHKPSIFAMAKVSEPWSASRAGHLLYISEFTTDIQYITGENNPVADALSRAVIASLLEGVNYEEMAKLQLQDEKIPTYCTSVTGLQWEDISAGTSGLTLSCDTSIGCNRPLVPRAMRRQVFDAVHNVSHPGINATVKLVSSKFVWHGLTKEVQAWAKSCLDCQHAKVHRHIRGPLEPFRVPAQRYGHIHIDLVGPLPPSQGCICLLTVMDHFTHRPEAILLSSTDTCAHAFTRN